MDQWASEHRTLWQVAWGIVATIGGAFDTALLVARVTSQPPLGAIIVASIVMLGGLYAVFAPVWHWPPFRQRPDSTRGDDPLPSSAVANEPPVAAGADTHASDRIFVQKTPQDLTNLFGRQTSILAQRQADAFYGKWMRVSGRLGDVSAWNGFSSIVTFARKTFGKDSTLFMMFRDEQTAKSRLQVLSAGERITVEGEIARIDRFSVQLTNCTLVDPPLVSQSASTSLPPSIAPQAESLEDARQPIFEQAPPELADMSAASLKDSFAGRTEAQGNTLMEQHVDKPVLVSGEVERVAIIRPSGIPTVTLRSTPILLLFFDPDDDYDPVPIVLSLNAHDRIVVSGRIHQIDPTSVSLHHCKLIEAHGRVA